MRFLSPETELFLYHVELEEKIRQVRAFRMASANRLSPVQWARQYWQQLRSRSATGSPACCH